MKLVSCERDDKNLVSLTVEVDAVAFEEAVSKAFKRNSARFNVPGFRKGKAPRKMIETLYGVGVMYEEAINIAYPAAFDQAVEEAGIEPVEQADVEVTAVGAEGLSFIARVHVYPEAEVGNYKGLHAFKPPVEVENETIESELSRLQKRNARLVTVERAVQQGDTAVIDFEGYVDDVPFEGGKGENYQLEIGSGRFIPGFEEQLVGHSAGDECKVEVTFPEEYHAPELAGHAAVFVVKIHEVKENEMPMLDDEFAKDVSEFDTMAQLRDSIRERLSKQQESMSEDTFENGLTEQIVAGTQVEVPDAMIEEQLSTLLQNLSYRLSAQGLDMATYAQLTGQTMEEIQNSTREQARRLTIANLAYEKIAVLEGIVISDEDVEAEYAKVAEQYQMPLARVKNAIPEKSLRRDISRLKASEFVKEKAFADDKEPEEPIVVTPKKTAPKSDSTQEAADKTPSGDEVAAKPKNMKAKAQPKEGEEKPRPAKAKKAASAADAEQSSVLD